MSQPTLESLAADFTRLQQVADELGEKVKSAARTMAAQSAVIGLALDELVALAETEAIPPFFRQQIGGTLLKMKEAGRGISV